MPTGRPPNQPARKRNPLLAGGPKSNRAGEADPSRPGGREVLGPWEGNAEEGEEEVARAASGG